MTSPNSFLQVRHSSVAVLWTLNNLFLTAHLELEGTDVLEMCLSCYSSSNTPVTLRTSYFQLLEIMHFVL